ncbi:MAG: hypothetical protein J6Q55_03475, partial [Clostridia bacterium]|nr:hypothetical protein [Clostridia bacterium]
MNKKVIALVILAVICALSATGCILCQELLHEHEFGEWSVVTAPTCTTNGQRERICACQEKEVETIPTIAHTYTPSVTSPTCTTPGYTTYTCACGHSYMGDHVQANGHTEVEHDAKAPTCTEIGWGAYVTCSSCDYTTYSELPATGHVEVVDQAVPATCTTTGLTEGKHCAVCNTVTLAQQTVNKVAHTEVIDQAVPATCTTTGLTEGKHCSICDTVIVAQQTVNKVAHTEVIDSAVPATCTTTGLTEGKHCSVCNTVLVAQTTVNALGHTLSEVKVENNVAATCTTDGSYDNVVSCTTCKVELSRNTVVVDKLGHDYKAVVTAPTCTTAGLTTHTCSRCQDSYTSNPTEATGHTEVTDQAVPATYTTTGLTEGKHCSVCDTVIVAQQTVNKVAHTEVTDQAVPATCSTEGLTEGKHCSVCDTVIV